VQPTDLSLLATPAGPELHPDGRRVAFTVARPDLDEDRYDRRIHVFDGTAARVFTHGPTDASPHWSPDGRWLAFLRKGEGKEDRAQVVVMPADGGEARPLTDLPLGAQHLAWAPDSRRLVVVGRGWVPELADLDDDERRRRPRRVTTLPYRGDDVGWVHERRDHLYLVDRDGAPGDEELLTPGDFDETVPAWHPDGDRIAFLSRRAPDRHVQPGDEVYELDLASREVREVVPTGFWTGVAYAPDGTLHAHGLTGALDYPSPLGVHRVGPDGVVAVAPGLDRQIGDARMRFLDDGRILVRVEDRGRVHVRALSPDGTVETLVGGDREVSGFDVRPDGSALAFTAHHPEDPGELYWAEGGDERVVTEVNRPFREQVALTKTRHVTFERDGVELDAWLLVPDTDEERVPLLLNIHGGPTAQWGFGFFDEFQVYAGAGYAVVATNPRGSSGRGRDWMRAVVGAWSDNASVDMLDLRATVDAALAVEPRLDPDRVGIMGGSYGGYATARIIADDHRFHSAVVERGLLQWESFSGTSDIGPYFDRMFLGADIGEGFEVHRAASPAGLAHRVTTPTLVLHSEHDWRCPIEQGEQYFVGLVKAGVEAEMLRFPEEGHELSRSGAPRHRVERFEAILDWHARHLTPS
jgi:dipeptidyl aminopeptidase/acylaminoacyl peptidase